MARQRTLEEKLEACINTLLQKELPYTHIFDINDAAAWGAAQAAERSVARRRARKYGVRPLHFLELPPEIRDQIYELVVKYRDCRTKDMIRLEPKSAWVSLYKRPALHPATQPAITVVSRQLRGETLPMFYGINEFCMIGSDADNSNMKSAQVCQWLGGIGVQNAQMIRSFQIFWYGSGTYGLLERVEQLQASSALAMVAKVTTCKTTRSLEQWGKWAYLAEFD
ncbi:hypothetical protein LTR97_002688 [Elasticomyces elasticus]|uniref:Uncharacterized protein n=1 Tax=Elasticomyces elasticus TaxID=574655 RepID=A0AAN7VVM5_9PEZI|nr:hypothetical protein LTR97_002688 [Elasticomyces elasticus]